MRALKSLGGWRLRIGRRSRSEKKELVVEPKTNAIYVEGDFGFAAFPHVVNKLYIVNILAYEIVHRREFAREKWGILPDMGAFFIAVFPMKKFRRHDNEHYRVFEYEFQGERSAFVVYRSSVSYVHDEDILEDVVEGNFKIRGKMVVDRVAGYYVLEDGSLARKKGLIIRCDPRTGIITEGRELFYTWEDKKELCCYTGECGIAAFSDKKIAKLVKGNPLLRKSLLVDEKFRYAGSPYRLRVYGKEFTWVVRPKEKAERLKRRFLWLKKGVVDLEAVYIDPLWRRGCNVYQYDGEISGERVVEAIARGNGVLVARDCEGEIATPWEIL